MNVESPIIRRATLDDVAAIATLTGLCFALPATG